jgi:hypothetical protein
MRREGRKIQLDIKQLLETPVLLSSLCSNCYIRIIGLLQVMQPGG